MIGKKFGKLTVLEECAEWLNDFMSFYEWAMNNGYKDNLTIDRIDVNGNYEPNNCRWVDQKTQQNNKKNNIYLTYDGKTKTIMECAEYLKYLINLYIINTILDMMLRLFYMGRIYNERFLEL